MASGPEKSQTKQMNVKDRVVSLFLRKVAFFFFSSKLIFNILYSEFVLTMNVRRQTKYEVNILRSILEASFSHKAGEKQEVEKKREKKRVLIYKFAIWTLASQK